MWNDPCGSLLLQGWVDFSQSDKNIRVKVTLIQRFSSISHLPYMDALHALDNIVDHAES